MARLTLIAVVERGGFLRGLDPGLLHVLGAQNRTLNFAVLEKFSRTWIRSESSAYGQKNSSCPLPHARTSLQALAQGAFPIHQSTLARIVQRCLAPSVIGSYP